MTEATPGLRGNFTDLLAASCGARESRLCVGLDPDIESLPAGFEPTPDDVLRFVTGIIEATAEFAAAYKPNSAFYEALGPAGMEVLQAVIAAVPGNTPVILDAKRGDMANTAERYATACFDVMNATAVTLNPYLGQDSLEPFMRRADRGCFVLCRTSNPGADDLQELTVDGRPLYLEVARQASAWNIRGNVGLVAGATRPKDLGAVRRECPGMAILVPGVGAQGGDLAAAARAAAGGSGNDPFIIAASRSITGASQGPDFQSAAAVTADELRKAINAAL
ncbi:MAG: orotidine-5-phosphate decarboxylase [Chloroflexota bacterium]|jgi:orotidine-5'-phosphate decarboxylase|nr:orotidine-5-phosphate decarboxylase [Chloroflexota bacterium]